jgi:uncharacterized protein YpuA (DUF1002 family)
MKHWKRALSLLLCVGALMSALILPVWAEESSDDSKPYLVLGQDLNADQLSTVLDLLGVENKDTYQQDYNVYYTTNAEEHEHLDNYLSQSVIGTKAYSSILLKKGEEGSGIHITTCNISYCTVEMYQNALITAGVSDVELVVAGPTNISGTAALVSAMKAYSIMTGEELDDASVDAANNEIVVTGELGDEIGDSDKAAELIAALKNELFADGKDITEDDINTAIDQISQELGITISDSLRQQIIDLMKKIANSNFDVSALKEQAKDLFNQVSSLVDEISGGDPQGFFTRIWNQIVAFFQNLLS